MIHRVTWECLTLLRHVADQLITRAPAGDVWWSTGEPAPAALEWLAAHGYATRPAEVGGVWEPTNLGRRLLAAAPIEEGVS